MGAVYEAVHRSTGRRVALKTLRTGRTIGRGLFSRFEREVRTAGQLDSQHIVQVLDAGVEEDTGRPFMVMELLAGIDLAHLLTAHKRLPSSLALRIAAQVCVGLEKAHDARITHRDIKPANLYLARKDGGICLVKVLDFGIAKSGLLRASRRCWAPSTP